MIRACRSNHPDIRPRQNLTVVYPQFGSIFASPSLDPPTAAFPYTAPVGAPIRVSIELPGGHFVYRLQPGPRGALH